MKLSDRFSFPFPKPKKKAEEEAGSQSGALDPKQVVPQRALVRLDLNNEEEIGIPPASAAADASGPDLDPTPLPTPPADLPLHLRNPGPPPRVPRNADLTTYGRTSYRLREIRHDYTNRRPLLWACAAIGLFLLFLLMVVKPQNRLLDNPVAVEPTPIVANVSAGSSSSARPTVVTVAATEQFGVVLTPEGLVLEEARNGATVVDRFKQYSVLNFQRKNSAGWYQLKGGSGWISAATIRLYPSEQAANDARREFESRVSSKP